MSKIMIKKSIALSVLLANTPLMAQEMDMSSMAHMNHATATPVTKANTPKTILAGQPKSQAKKTIPKKAAPQQKADSMKDMPEMNHGSMQMPTSAKSDSSNMAGMDHSSMSQDSMDIENMKSNNTNMTNMDHGTMKMPTAISGPSDIAGMDHNTMEMSGDDMAGMDHSTMKMGKMQGGQAPKDARSPDYSQGRDYGPIAPPHMMGNGIMMSALFDQLELSRNSNQTYGNYVFDGWVGNDWNRLALKAEGEIANSKLEEARTELLWRKPIGIFWNTELGIRQDSGIEKSQSWLAMGVNGISPYWIELGATVYVAQNNRTALRAEATYDWRILQRVILQPSLEVNFYGKTDVARNLGKGLSDIQAGMRLRYEVNRQFAPYIGIETTQQFGKTADLLKVSGEKTQKTSAVAGIRFWF